MGVAFAPIGTATCMLAFLISSQLTLTLAQTAQQDQTITATAKAPIKSDGCTATMGNAYGLCMAKALFNITGVNCDCTQRNAPGGPWECGDRHMQEIGETAADLCLHDLSGHSSRAASVGQ
jgi:hypothetical protein